MNNIKDFGTGTTIYELLTHLYEKVTDGEITTFSELVDYTSIIPDSKKKHYTLMKVFTLIRKLYWGFFNDINKEDYPKLWKELVILNELYNFGGDLKRNTTIANIYAGILDIHGYTKFCEEAGRNLSQLQLLDDCIQHDVREISRENGVLCQRARGDEIVMIGTTAADMLQTTISITDYFSRRRIIKSDELSKIRGGTRIILQDMSISAGIAGGRIYTPLIITTGGDISGSVINTAARLQARANKISGDQNRILITKQVYAKFVKQHKVSPSKVAKTAVFFDVGMIKFKGVDINLFEVIINENEKYRGMYQKEIRDLYDALAKGLWENRIFSDIMTIIETAASKMTPFKVKVAMAGNPHGILTNQKIVEFAGKLQKLYETGNSYQVSIDTFARLVEYLELIPHFDGLVLEYARKIYEKYDDLSRQFNLELEKIIQQKQDNFFSLDEKDQFLAAKKQLPVYESLLEKAMKNKEVINHKSLWLRLIEMNREQLGIELYSAKY